MILNPFTSGGSDSYTAIKISGSSTSYTIPTGTKFILFVGTGWIAGFSYLLTNSSGTDNIEYYYGGRYSLGTITNYNLTTASKFYSSCTAFCFK